MTLADHHLKTGKLIEAAVEWRQVLGPAFPVPGGTPLRTLPLFLSLKVAAARPEVLNFSLDATQNSELFNIYEYDLAQ